MCVLCVCACVYMYVCVLMCVHVSVCVLLLCVSFLVFTIIIDIHDSQKFMMKQAVACPPQLLVAVTLNIVDPGDAAGHTSVYL